MSKDADYWEYRNSPEFQEQLDNLERLFPSLPEPPEEQEVDPELSQ